VSYHQKHSQSLGLEASKKLVVQLKREDDAHMALAIFKAMKAPPVIKHQSSVMTIGGLLVCQRKTEVKSRSD
jgi:hypothetical protein